MSGTEHIHIQAKPNQNGSSHGVGSNEPEEAQIITHGAPEEDRVHGTERELAATIRAIVQQELIQRGIQVEGVGPQQGNTSNSPSANAVIRLIRQHTQRTELHQALEEERSNQNDQFQTAMHQVPLQEERLNDIEQAQAVPQEEDEEGERSSENEQIQSTTQHTGQDEREAPVGSSIQEGAATQQEDTSGANQNTTTTIRPAARPYPFFRNVRRAIGDDAQMTLDADIFTLMMLSKPCCSRSWVLGSITFTVFQFTLGGLIIFDQWIVDKRICNNMHDEASFHSNRRLIECIPFDVPIQVSSIGVTIAQYIVVVLVLATQSDVLMSIQTITMLRNSDDVAWHRVIGEEEKTWWLWIIRVLFPNMMKFLGGLVILSASSIIIIQSNRIIDLLKDSMALLFVSEADNIMFHLAYLGYFGDRLRQEARKAMNVQIPEDERIEGDRENGRPEQPSIMEPEQHPDQMEDEQGEDEDRVIDSENGRPEQTLARESAQHLEQTSNRLCCRTGYIHAFFLLCLLMLTGLTYFVIHQWNGTFLRKKYPFCHVTHRRWIGNGICNDFPPYNTPECDLDGGDCDPEEVDELPGCKVHYPSLIFDDFCDDSPNYNSPECGYDGGFCVPQAVDGLPDCSVPYPLEIGNGYCKEYSPYNTPECNYDGGDCLFDARLKGFEDCFVTYPEQLGDGYCLNSPPYNTPECNYDGGDCILKAADGLPDCLLLPEHHEWLGNEWCNDYPPLYSAECGWDDGDCPPPVPVTDKPDCAVPFPHTLGDGHCRDWPPYNTPECNYDGGDCTDDSRKQTVDGLPNCLVLFPTWIGNRFCDDHPPYNTPECNYDGGDCPRPKVVDGHPDCYVSYPQYIGNGYCNNFAPYNTPECDFDGGDCPMH